MDDEMRAVKLRGHVGPDGLLKLELRVDAANQDVEAIVIVEVPAQAPLVGAAVDEQGYPVNFFERLDQMPGMALTQRPDQGVVEVRDRLARELMRMPPQQR